MIFKAPLSTIIVLLIYQSVFALLIPSPPKDGIYFDFGGASYIYSISYQKNLVQLKENMHLDMQSGIGINPLPRIESNTLNSGKMYTNVILNIPVSILYSLVHSNQRFSWESGFSMTYSAFWGEEILQNNDAGQSKKGFNVTLGGSSGIKLTPPYRKLFFKVKAHYLVPLSGESSFYPGIAIGWQI